MALRKIAVVSSMILKIAQGADLRGRAARVVNIKLQPLRPIKESVAGAAHRFRFWAVDEQTFKLPTIHELS